MPRHAKAAHMKLRALQLQRSLPGHAAYMGLQHSLCHAAEAPKEYAASQGAGRLPKR